MRKGDPFVLKEEIQLFKGSEWEPPYGVLLMTKNELVITSEGKDLSIPRKDVGDVTLVKSEDTLWNKIYGGAGIKIDYKKQGKKKSAPVFSSAIGVYSGVLGHAREKRTALVLEKIRKQIGK